MEERLRGAIVRAVESAGAHAMNNGSKKPLEDTEKRARDIMLREIRDADPMLGRWGDGIERERALAVCPLDGVMNYSRRFGPFSVMAAYLEAGKPVFGALFLPLSGELITAEAGKGARLGGRRLGVGRRNELRVSITCAACDCYLYDMGQTGPMALDIITKLSLGGIPWRNSGSSGYDFAALALGRADAVAAPVQGAHAAGYLIMEEAGAVLSDADGKQHSLSSEMVIAANPGLHPILLEFLQDPTR
ncbi:MAG TPA: inositol monophosphatase family protein [Candidatus Bilamarchaeum sp.]|nr:inositol monophosphatase family protein [Candidatus Bilamarchaeum sp.]